MQFNQTELEWRFIIIAFTEEPDSAHMMKTILGCLTGLLTIVIIILFLKISVSSIDTWEKEAAASLLNSLLPDEVHLSLALLFEQGAGLRLTFTWL